MIHVSVSSRRIEVGARRAVQANWLALDVTPHVGQEKQVCEVVPGEGTSRQLDCALDAVLVLRHVIE